MAKKSLSNQDQMLIKRLLLENLKKHLPLYAVAIVSMIVMALATGASAAIMRNIVNSLVDAKQFSHVLLVGEAVAAIFIIKGIANYLQMVYLSKAGNSIIAEQQRKIYQRLMQQGVAFFDRNTASDLLVRVTNSAQAARSIIDLLVTTYVRDAISVISLIAVMIWTNYWLALIAVVVTPLIFLVVRQILKKIRLLTAIEISSIAQIIQVVQETSLGIRVIKAFALEPIMTKRMNKAIGDVEERANAIAKLSATTRPMMESLAGLAIASIVIISGYILLQTHGTPGDLMAFITAILLAYEPAKRLANSRVQLETGLIAVRMMFDIMDQPITLKEDENAVPLPAGPGHIELKDLTFSYLSEHPVLKNISLDIPAKKITALVGPSGAGKTTLVNLILRLYDPQEGSIFIDGFDIRHATFKSLRERISYVGQQTFLFQDTVRQNILLGKPDATEEEIIAAAKAANAHDFICELPNGYDTPVGDNGNNLSGGQRQRIAIARAMLRDSEILILDEATSSLDSQSENLIQQALERLTKERTTIIIAHRFSTIAKADNIVVLQHGTIQEQGSQEELISKEEGIYKTLYDLQFNQATQKTVQALSLDLH